MQPENLSAALGREGEELLQIGDRLADAAERLEQNPLANCLPRFRWPVQDAVDDWRTMREKVRRA